MTRDIGLNPEQSKVKKLVVGARQYAEKDRLQEAEKEGWALMQDNLVQQGNKLLKFAPRNQSVRCDLAVRKR